MIDLDPAVIEPSHLPARAERLGRVEQQLFVGGAGGLGVGDEARDVPVEDVEVAIGIDGGHDEIDVGGESRIHAPQRHGEVGQRGGTHVGAVREPEVDDLDPAVVGAERHLVPRIGQRRQRRAVDDRRRISDHAGEFRRPAVVGAARCDDQQRRHDTQQAASSRPGGSAAM